VRHFQLAVCDQVEPVARLALADHRLAGRDGDGDERTGEALDRRRIERCEEPVGAHQADLDDGHGRRPVGCEQPFAGSQRDERQERREREQRGGHAADRHERRRQQRADREGGHRQALDDAEDAGEPVGAYDALKQSSSCDVEQRARRAGDGEQENGTGDAR
jgi:hypothetical protein